MIDKDESTLAREGVSDLTEMALEILRISTSDRWTNAEKLQHITPILNKGVSYWEDANERIVQRRIQLAEELGGSH